MRALRSRHRIFVEHYVFGTLTNSNKNNYGTGAEAARKAGYGSKTARPLTLAHIAWCLMRDDRILAAMAEETIKARRATYLDAVKALQDGIRNPDHKDHARFVAMSLDRNDPIESRQFRRGHSQTC